MEAVTKFTFKLWNEHYESPLDPVFDDCDVYVTLESGKKYVSTAYTPESLRRIFDRLAESEDGEGSMWFFDRSMFLVPRVDRANVEAAIRGLIRDGLFEKAFEKCTSEELSDAQG